MCTKRFNLIQGYHSIRPIASDRFRAIGTIAAFMALAYFPIFSHLGTLPIRLWDESRLANNVFEMSQDGDFIVTHYDEKPDMWNTKPPLLIWIQVLSVKMLGYNEIAIRLPSAVAAFLTCLVCILFAKAVFSDYILGWIAGLILLTTNGFIHVHVSRTGDYDALTVLWTTVYSLSYFVFLTSTSDKKRGHYLLATTLGMILAVLTKGIVGLLFVPALAVFTLISGELSSLLRSRRFYLNLLLFTAVTVGYYLFREFRNNGFLEAVYNNELGGRYLSTIERHKEGFLFYYYKLRDLRFSPWLFFLPLGFAVGLSSKCELRRSFSIYALLIITTFLLIISFGQTKLEWYDAPMLPIASLLVAVGISHIVVLMMAAGRHNQVITHTAAILLIFALFFQPYKSIVNKVSCPNEYRWNEEKYGISHYLRRVIQKGNSNSTYVVTYDGYNAHIKFYSKILHMQGSIIEYRSVEELNPLDIVVASQQSVKQRIGAMYLTQIIDSYKEATVYRITAKREQELPSDSER